MSCFATLDFIITPLSGLHLINGIVHSCKLDTGLGNAALTPGARLDY